MAREGWQAGLDEATFNKLKKVSEGCYQAFGLAYKTGVKIGSVSDLLDPFQNLKGRESFLLRYMSV